MSKKKAWTIDMYAGKIPPEVPEGANVIVKWDGEYLVGKVDFGGVTDSKYTYYNGDGIEAYGVLP